MSTKINVLSPFYKKVGNVDLDFATLSLYIYEGVFTTDKAGSLRYTLVKRPVNGNNYVVFEIADLVKDYLTTSFDGEYTSQTVWVEADVVLTLTDETTESDNSDYIAYAGYGYFEEGINPELNQGLLISNSVIYRRFDYNVRVPLNSDVANSIDFYLNGVLKRSQAVSSSTNTAAQIVYLAVSGSGSEAGNDDLENYQARVEGNGGTFENSPCLQYFLSLVDIGLVDELRVTTDDGVEVVRIESICEPKYTPYKVTFLNKFGALQDMWFFKKSVESITTNQEMYKRSTMDLENFTYSTSAHQMKTFNKNGKETITMNTGYIDDSFNDVIRQLLLSEQVWMTKEDDQTVLPLNVVTNSLTYKTGVNDKLVDYTIDFEYAYDKINNIR